jgi:hypothetical protein
VSTDFLGVTLMNAAQLGMAVGMIMAKVILWIFGRRPINQPLSPTYRDS